MNCDFLNGFDTDNCFFGIAGIKRVNVFRFDEIDSYSYDMDDLNYVTGFSAVNMPTVYEPKQDVSEYTGVNQTTAYNLYENRLTLGFDTMSEHKRQETKALEALDLTIIIEDRNGKCWILGQEYPCRLDSVNVGTGTKDGFNGYELVFRAVDKEHPKRIDCPNYKCFNSISATESRKTTFEVTDSDSLTWDSIETDINGTVVMLDTSSNPLMPFLWSVDPLVLANDRNTLYTLFGSLDSNVHDLVTTYDAATKVTTISITSNNSVYGVFGVDSTLFNKVSYIATVNIRVLVSIGLNNPSTIIELVDGAGDVVFSLPYGSSVSSLTGFTGTTDDFTFESSNLYPSGSTFEISVLGADCLGDTFEYNYINSLQACLLDRSYSFGKDIYTSIEIPYIVSSPSVVVNQRFQNTTINIFGTHFQLYKDCRDWHDDYNQFVNDVLNLFSNAQLNIDYATFTDTDTGTSVKLDFVLTDIEPEYYFRSQIVNVDGAFDMAEWQQARNVNIKTFAPVGSIVNHTDQHSNIIDGDNLVNITQNTFDLGFNPLGNNSIENVSLLWNWPTVPYSITSFLTTDSLGGDCYTLPINKMLGACYEGYNSDKVSDMVQVTLECAVGSNLDLGNQFFIEYSNNGSVSVNAITTPFVVTPNKHMHRFTEFLNRISGIRVVHYDFDVSNRLYNFWIEVDNNTEILNLKDGDNRDFTINKGRAMYKNTFTTSVNPFVKPTWNLPTIYNTVTTPSEDFINGFWELLNVETPAVSVSWNQEEDEVRIIRNSGFNDDITIGFHEEYPTHSNAILDDTLFVGDNGRVISEFSVVYQSLGGDTNKIEYISYTNSLGWMIVKPVNFTLSEFEIVFKEVTQIPLCFGTPDSIKYVGGKTLSAPFISAGALICDV